MRPALPMADFARRIAAQILEPQRARRAAPAKARPPRMRPKAAGAGRSFRGLEFQRAKIWSSLRESLEFQRISARIGHEEGGLLARLPLEADARLDEERGARAAQFPGQFPPLGHVKNNPEMADRNLLAIDEIMPSLAARTRA